MKKLLIILSLVFPMALMAQDTYFGKDDMSKVKLVTLSAQSDATNGTTRSISEVYTDFASKISEKWRRSDAELKNNKEYIVELYKAMANDNDDFKFSGLSWQPLVVSYRSGKAIIFNNIIYQPVFDKNSLDVSQKASLIARNVANLIYGRIAETATTAIPYIGLCIGYCCDSTSAKTVFSEADCLVVVAPVAAIKDFGSGAMEAGDFMEQCDYYLDPFPGNQLKKLSYLE